MFALMAAVSLSLGAENELPAWAVLMPIWIWIGLAAAVLCLVFTVALTCLPLIMCCKNDNECDTDYCCLPCHVLNDCDAEKGPLFIWGFLNVMPFAAICCVLLPIR